MKKLVALALAGVSMLACETANASYFTSTFQGTAVEVGTGATYALRLDAVGEVNTLTSVDGVEILGTTAPGSFTVTASNGWSFAFTLASGYYPNPATMQFGYIGPATASITGIGQTLDVLPSFSTIWFSFEPRIAPLGASYTLTPQSPVPETATWGLMIAGFGLVGSMMRRRPMQMLSR